MADKAKQAMLNKAKTDKFILVFTTPESLKDTATKNERRTHQNSRAKVMPDSMQYSVFGIIVPQISIPNIALPYAGQSLNVSTHARPAYDPITVEFTVDNQFNNYWYIWRWLDVMNDSKESRFDARDDVRKLNSERRYLEEYQTDVSLFGLNEYDNKVIEFKYTKSFPVQLGSIDYSYREPQEIQSSFTFAFSQLHVSLL